MDATSLLKRDHDAVRALFARLQDESGAGRRLETLRELAADLVLHSQLEEEFFYPALEESDDAEGRQLVAEAGTVHAHMEDLIERLIGMDPRDSEFGRAVGELERTVQGHVREEESRLFPVAARALGPSRLDAIGRAITERRERLEAAA